MYQQIFLFLKTNWFNVVKCQVGQPKPKKIVNKESNVITSHVHLKKILIRVQVSSKSLFFVTKKAEIMICN